MARHSKYIKTTAKEKLQISLQDWLSLEDICKICGCSKEEARRKKQKIVDNYSELNRELPSKSLIPTEDLLEEICKTRKHFEQLYKIEKNLD